MKKKLIVSCLAVSAITLTLSGCTSKNQKTDVILREDETLSSETAESSTANVEEVTVVEEEGLEEASGDTQEVLETEESTIESLEDALAEDVSALTEGELEARRTQQAKFNEARELLYTLPDSKDKTLKITQMDKQIVANNAYDFSNTNIVFIGDSITEGITSAINTDGTYISYVTYVSSYLRFNKCLNHGKGGRMFSDYGGEEYSLAFDFSNVTNIDSDIIVVFAGINDYLSTMDSKRFGDLNNTESTAGYCGMARMFMKQLDMYYGDRDVFIVTMYDVSKTAECTYSDYEGQPTLNDYLDVQRKLAEEYGFNVIELYDTGFMDCTDAESSDYYLRDGLHPKDNGNIALGAHIAAELSLYYSQK